MANMKPFSAHVKEELHPWDTSTPRHMHYVAAGVKEELHPRDTSTTRHMHCVAAGVKEEPLSDLGQNLDRSTPAVHIKVEPSDYDDPPHDDHPQYLTNHIKEESCDYKERLPGGDEIPPPYSTLYTSTLSMKEEAESGEEDLECTTFCIKEEAESGEEDLEYTTFCIKEEAESGEEDLECTTFCIKEEPVSGDEGDFPPVNIGGRGISGAFHDDSTLGGDEESDGLSDHTEVEYTAVRIKGEESSEEDYVEVVPDTDNYATRDHTYMVTRTDDRMKAPCNTRKLHKTLNCSECGKVFFGKAAYRLHQKLHRGEAVYACSTCGKKFSRKGSCEKHQEAAHIREKSFQCPNCDRYFSSKLGLTLHQRVHTREPTFACKDCAKSFTSNSALIQHQRVHYTDRRLVCAKCGVTFHNKSDLINHEILHPVQQSFVCSECSEKFLTKAELSAHWKVHTVIKAFAWRKIHFTHQETGGPEETSPGGQ